MIFELAQDFHDAATAMPKEHPKRGLLAQMQEALMPAVSVVAADPLQFRSQIHGRLAGHSSSEIRALLSRAEPQAIGPWLQPLTASLVACSSGLSTVLHGHTAPVTCVAFSPDGRTLAAGSANYDHLLSGNYGHI